MKVNKTGMLLGTTIGATVLTVGAVTVSAVMTGKARKQIENHEVTTDEYVKKSKRIKAVEIAGAVIGAIGILAAGAVVYNEINDAYTQENELDDLQSAGMLELEEKEIIDSMDWLGTAEEKIDNEIDTIDSMIEDALSEIDDLQLVKESLEDIKEFV